MRRREFITLLGGAAAGWPLVALGQQKALPVIGFMSSRSPEDSQSVLAGFRKGLSESGIVEGKDVVIEFRWALSQQRVTAMLLVGNPFFDTNRNKIIAFAAQQKLPAMYHFREYVVDGGLMSYGTSLGEAYREAGVYAAKILDGAKPSDLPVLQSTKIELVINLKTAKTLGLTIPASFLSLADELVG